MYPSRCPICDRVLPVGCIVCPECEKGVRPITGSLCRKCGRRLLDEREEYCPECRKIRHIYREGRALYEYSDVRRSIYRFKYMGRREYARFYGTRMAEHLGRSILGWRPDALVPVPLHKKREAKRGYNQAELLARVVGESINVPVRTDLAFRRLNTKPMKTLNPKERENNLKKAFIIEGDVVKLNVIVLVDDIYTTGSTVDALAKEFIKKGVREVYYISLATARD